MYSVGLDKCTACFHHRSVIQNSFSALNIFCAVSIHPPANQPLATTDLFIVVIVLPFLECGILAITECSRYRLVLSFNNINLRFLHILS